MQKDFSLENWEDAYKAIPTPDEDDSHLIECVRFFAAQLAALRRALAAAPAPPGTAVQRYRRAVGAVNQQCLDTREEAREHPVPEVIFLPDLLRRKVKLAGNINSVTQPQLVESVVDGLRLELGAIRGQGKPDPLPVGRGSVRRIALRMNLSVFYHMLEEQWLDCLHHGISLLPWADGVALGPHTNPTIAEDYAVGVYREDCLNLELVVRSREFRESYSERRKGVVRDRRPKKKYRVVSVPREVTRAVVLAHFVAIEPDIEPLTDHVVDSATGLTVAELLEIWGFLVPLVHPSTTRSPDCLRIETADQLEQFAPIHHAGALQRALQLGTRLSQAKCAAGLATLTWRGVRDSLWHRPFVSIDTDRLVIVAQALETPNLRRSIEHWLALSPNALSERGGAFEVSLRQQLCADTRANRRLSDAGFADAEQYPDDANVGDIDLLGWVGNTVLVGEVKCLVRPATSHEWFQHEESIQKAVGQVQRKVAWLHDNMPWLCRTLGRDFADDIAILPCIVVNFAASALRVVKGVPVVDRHILTRFFGLGYGSQFVRSDAEEESERVEFYSSDEEAAASLRSYLVRPPHLSAYRDSITYRALWQPDFTAPGQWILWCYPEVDVSIPEAAKLRC